MDNKLQIAKSTLHRLESDEDTLKLLPALLKELSYDDKIEFMADILCEEWYLISHFEFIKSVLDIFAKSL